MTILRIHRHPVELGLTMRWSGLIPNRTSMAAAISRNDTTKTPDFRTKSASENDSVEAPHRPFGSSMGLPLGCELAYARRLSPVALPSSMGEKMERRVAPRPGSSDAPSSAAAALPPATDVSRPSSRRWLCTAAPMAAPTTTLPSCMLQHTNGITPKRATGRRLNHICELAHHVPSLREERSSRRDARAVSMRCAPRVPSMGAEAPTVTVSGSKAVARSAPPRPLNNIITATNLVPHRLSSFPTTVISTNTSTPN
mmetsp:Transcript_7792/g.16212  ORF Transcript_7792/g.16212 Transcript_7792/m.16212 type:complete len:255 (-) Transcript_7792:552-1316(-)